MPYPKILIAIGGIALFSFSCFALLVATIHAQNKPLVDLTVNPSTIDLTANPGDKLQEKFRIRNNTTQPLQLAIKAGKLTSTSETGEATPADPAPTDGYISWIKFDPATLNAPTKEWTEVKYSIDIPKDAAFGYYYVIRIVQTGQDNQDQTSPTAKLKGEVLIPLLLTVRKEGAISQAKLLDFKPKSLVNEYLPVDFSARISNNGNIHIRPHGNVFIRGTGEKDLAVLEINQSFGAILPQGIRNFETGWSDGFFVKTPVMDGDKVKTDKNGQPVTKLTVNWNKLTSFRIGKYNANLVMVFDDGKRDVAIEGTTSFWVIPYTIIGSTLVALVAIFLLVRFLIRLYIRRELRKYRPRS
jgi:hypothetical protein